MGVNMVISNGTYINKKLNFIKTKNRFLSKSNNYSKTTKFNYLLRNLIFLISKDKVVFISLKLTFIEAITLTHFSLNWYI